MAANDFLPFGATAGVNVLSNAAWTALAARTGGFSTGIANAVELNKAWRQSGTMAAMIGAFIQTYGFDAFDDGNPVTVSLLPNFIAALNASQTGRLLNIRQFTTVGATTYISTPGTKSVIVEVQAGGGAGGGCVATGVNFAAGGVCGCAGAYGKGQYFSAFEGITITVGAGGLPVGGSNGLNGGASSFGGLLTCPGGPGGGGGGVLFSGPFAGGQGNVVSPTGANLISMLSDTGGFTIGNGAAPSISISSAGARTPFGAGPAGRSINQNGNDAISYGTSGTGTSANSTSGTLIGGKGMQGIVQVWEYA